MADTIRCPHCGAAVEIGARLRDQVREEVLCETRAREAALAAREEALRQGEKQAEERLQALLAERLRGAVAKARKEAADAVGAEMQDVQRQLAEARTGLAQARKAELDLRRERLLLEESKQELELTIARRMDEERARVRDEARKAAEESQALQLRERNEQIEGLRRTIEELKRKAEQGSQQLQGEVLEHSLEEALRREFPFDVVEPVAKGVRGADVVQRVRGSGGVEAGVILWESKRTKAWADAWLPKLRDDQRAMRADVAALVTQVLPSAAAPIGNHDGVWVTDYRCYLGLAHALRRGLIEVASARRSQEGRQEKMAILYEYLTGHQFRNRIEGLLEPFVALKEDLESEKRALERVWSRREKQIERAWKSTAGLYGDLEGIVGAALPDVKTLHLPGHENGNGNGHGNGG